jgi:hypothetical protein
MRRTARSAACGGPGNTVNYLRGAEITGLCTKAKYLLRTTSAAAGKA